jgi:hypothetical protein
MVRIAFARSVLALLLPGCAHNAEWLTRRPPVQSTIGNDPNKAPAGRMIPPARMGDNVGDRSCPVLDGDQVV